MDRDAFAHPGAQARVGLVQMNIEDGSPEKNLARALDMLASAPPADLYLLPELWTTGYAQAVWDDAADHHTPVAVERLASEAVVREAWIGGSLVSRRSDGKLTNRFWLQAPDGNVAATYDKVHLFALMGEPRRMAEGDRRVRVGMGAWIASLSLCYDLRFPEMYRRDAIDGAELFLVVSEWPAERRGVLELLARARAAENQACLALCNRTGTAADGTVFGGGSILADPAGDIVCRGGEGEEVVLGTLELNPVRAARRAIPVLEEDRGDETPARSSE